MKKSKKIKKQDQSDSFECTLNKAFNNYFNAIGDKKKRSQQAQIDLLFNGNPDDTVKFALFLVSVLDEVIHN